MNGDEVVLVDIPDDGPPDLERIREITTTCTVGHQFQLRPFHMTGGLALFGDGVQICDHPSEAWIEEYAKSVPEIRTIDLTRLDRNSGHERCCEPIVSRKLRGLPAEQVTMEEQEQ